MVTPALRKVAAEIIFDDSMVKIRPILHFGLTAIGIGVLLVLGAWLAAAHKTRVAAELLSAIKALPVGIASYEDAVLLKSRFQGVTGQNCGPEACSIAFIIDNRSMNRLGLAPPTRLTADLEVRNDRVTIIAVRLGVQSGRNPGDEFQANLWELASGLSKDDFQLSFSHGGPGFRQWRATAHITPRASRAERDLAFNLNLSCLHKFGGCKDSEQIVPKWWQQEDKHPHYPE